VYSFALLLTELLTDRVPTEGRDVVALLKAAIDPTVRPTPRQRGANVPDGIEVVCRRALAVDPKVRYASIAELWAALDNARRSPPPSVVRLRMCQPRSRPRATRRTHPTHRSPRAQACVVDGAHVFAATPPGPPRDTWQQPSPARSPSYPGGNPSAAVSAGRA